MDSLLVVFLLTVLAAGIWHGGRTWVRGHKRPEWLRASIDDKRGLWLLLMALPIAVLFAMAAIAVAAAAFR